MFNNGLLGKKIGMSQVFLEDGRVQAVTIIKAGPCTVVQVKTEDREGYDAVQLGFNDVKQLMEESEDSATKLRKFRNLREFRIKDPEAVEVGQQINVSIFKTGDLVDIAGFSKGKGFAGVVKRYHFAGGPKTHGQSDRHRAPGSIGATTSPGRVLKGKKMAGHMGNKRITTRNLRVYEADEERDLLVVKGAVPGPKNNLLLITRSRGAE
jgi:large subunit ribosomal protein L3